MVGVKLPFDPIIFGREADRSAVQRTRQIGFLIYPDFEILDLCGPLDAFYYAERALGLAGRVAEPGYQPVVIAARFVEFARVEAARCRLEQSDLTLQTIAEHCGFATLERMRRAFKRRLGVGPHEYRERFQSTL